MRSLEAPHGQGGTSTPTPLATAATANLEPAAMKAPTPAAAESTHTPSGGVRWAVGWAVGWDGYELGSVSAFERIHRSGLINPLPHIHSQAV